MTFDSLINEGEYFPPFYLDEILPKQLRGGPLKEWTALERQGQRTPRQGLRDLAQPYLAARAALATDAEKYHAVTDTRAVAAQKTAADVLKAVSAESDPPAFQPARSDAGPGSTQGPAPAPGALVPDWAANDTPESVWRADLAAWHRRLLTALGFDPIAPGHVTATTPTGLVAVPVAHHEPGLVVLTGGFATDVDATRGDGSANRLATPVRIASGKSLTTVTDLAAWLLTNDNAPRYALLLFGGVMVLGDKDRFSRGQYLAVSLDTALPRKAAKGATAGELDLIAAVFGAPSLRPGEDGSDDDIAKLVAESRDHSVGVTAELRVGLQKSVHLIANEVLDLARSQGVHPDDLQDWLPEVLKEPGDLPKLLTHESLRYLYRLLFLLYAEARPELDIVPMKSDEYVTGYSVARLRELVAQEKLGSASRRGHHFHDSLALLFDKVFTGHPVADTVKDRTTLSAASAAVTESTEPVAGSTPDPDSQPRLAEDDGHAAVRIEALRSRLFDPESIRLVGQKIAYPTATLPDSSPAPAKSLDLRLRNEVLHQVLRHLTFVEGKGKSHGAFISYANLSINHLGAVYEGLMSYTGFIAREALYEVAKGGDESGGSWLVEEGQVRSGRYPDEPGNSVFVKDVVDRDTGETASRVHPVGSYVYRLAGRDRQTSASYYTPKSLTEAAVEQTLRFRLDDEGRVDPLKPEKAWVNAADVLRWRVCEPALGSGAFLNEAVDQLAALYLKLAQRERGVEIDPEDYQRELQKAKAYIALHNAYGVDLNDTAVELAEISLWLNTMHPGMKAPWYGLHLHQGNSLVGAARKVYPGHSLYLGGWLNAKEQQRPRHVPLTERLKHREVHQFLLPALGWGSIAEQVSVRKPKKGAAADEQPVSVAAGSVADWLDPELIEAMKRWRSAMRRNPKGEQKPKTKKAASSAADARDKAAVTDERIGQGAFDLGLDLWEQGGFDFSGTNTDAGATAEAAAVSPPKQTAKEEKQAAEAESEGKQGRTQTGRLMALARRVEYLWDLVRLRLDLSEREIARTIDVWGATAADVTKPHGAVLMDRDAVVQALRAEGSPYWRLKQLMDAWCALWFWPLEEVGLLNGSDPVYWNGDEDLTRRGKGQAGGKVALKSLEDWIAFAEALVGRVDTDDSAGTLEEIPKVSDLPSLDTFETELDRQMTSTSAWVSHLEIGDLFPWYGTSYEISAEHGFFHWELNFAHVFAEGGFDLLVGNPPWVRQEWDEPAVLAEIEPWFVLGGKAAEAQWSEEVERLLRDPRRRSFYLNELETVAGISGFLSSPDTYPELVGTRPDMYRAFMLQAWRVTGERGIAGLIHPSTHLTGAKEGVLRRAAYRHLRFHADFTNELLIFANPVGNSSHFSVNVYGAESEIKFQHMSWLLHPHVLTKSLRHDGTGPVPAVKNDGKWDLRAHRDRIVTVDPQMLADWQKLAGEDEPGPTDEAKLLFPVTRSEESAIAALARWPHRLGALDSRISTGFNEKTDRTAGYFTWTPGRADQWNEVILQGPMFSVATLYHKQPPEGGSKSMRDYEPWDHLNLAEDEVPRTNYRRACVESRFVAAQNRWVDFDRVAQLRADPEAMAAAEADVDVAQPELTTEARDKAVELLLRAASMRPYSDFFRVGWRVMIASNTERSLMASMVPPGPVHVDLVNTMALKTDLDTTLSAGFWSSLASDYYLRINNIGHLRIGEASSFPAPTPDHPLADALVLRTLRLNAQTNAYAPLWNKLYDPTWQADTWAAVSAWPSELAPLADGVTPTWTPVTPLRTELARRAALVEIDALVAVWLGISKDELVAMYNARFPVLKQYEENMWFDATGRRIAKAHQQHGYGQPKDAWKQLSAPELFPLEHEVPEGYAEPLHQANRITEMKAAHDTFTKRLRDAGWEPGDAEPPRGSAG
ncbi:class I SAM-dependent DNA methyltransferase [Streptomyces canus]|uniref:Eco57I restriction-modification methylase domain-containing protein n=1 Tax=Streptomyces canus TaxID=58343 RepID=UPI0030E00EBA